MFDDGQDYQITMVSPDGKGQEYSVWTANGTEGNLVYFTKEVEGDTQEMILNTASIHFVMAVPV